ncbi:MAG: DNA polymerase IV [bacterium]|nr:DNA polymerase IV [bacterium]MDD5756719.1 DNA polymerase IV [bacterium]
MNNRIVLHIDMNAFFASIEQKTNPALRGRPVIVCGNPETRTVVSAASYEAKPFGIKAGMSIGEARRLCPQAIFVIGNLAKYVDTSRQIFNILRRFSAKTEIFSIDEAFLDISDTCSSYAGALQTGQAIKKAIAVEMGLTCSVGIGPNKLIAKLASDMKKPDGLILVPPEQVSTTLENLPIKDLCGVGRQMEKHLHALGIYTCGDLGCYPASMLRQHFGIVGEVLHNMGLGLDSAPVHYSDDEPPVKSMGHTHTLARDTADVDEIRRNIFSLSEQVAVRLRKDNYCGRTVCLILRYSDFFTFSRHLTVDYFLDSGYDIYQQAWKIFTRLDWQGRAVRLIGISVSNLVHKTRQLYLLEEFTGTQSVDRVMDRINEKYGEFRLIRAAMMKSERKLVQPILARGLWAKTFTKGGL